jgi:carbamoyl-phosphate synthase large subunit
MRARTEPVETMPKRTDIKTILIIGAGPIIIGQACEFDYSGTQACKALKEEGYRIILVNSNPATIMTDPGLADATYIEPITPESSPRSSRRNAPTRSPSAHDGRPDRAQLQRSRCEHGRAGKVQRRDDRRHRRGHRQGRGPRAVPRGDDQDRPRNAALACGVKTLGAALDALEDIGLPAIIRPVLHLGGTGGGIAYNRGEFIDIVERGMLDASPTSEVLIEESVLGWKEYEMEVVRDKQGQLHHRLLDREHRSDGRPHRRLDHRRPGPDADRQGIPDHARRLAGGAARDRRGNRRLQRAVRHQSQDGPHGRHRDEPARVAVLGAGVQGHRLPHRQGRGAACRRLHARRDSRTTSPAVRRPASFEPTIDYVVTKIPRFAFEKFPGAEPTLTTAMKSVGEAMAIGRTFQESLQKALRSLETGLDRPRRDRHRGYRPGRRQERDQGSTLDADARTASCRSPRPCARLHQRDIHEPARSTPGSWSRCAASSTPRRRSANTACRRRRSPSASSRRWVSPMRAWPSSPARRRHRAPQGPAPFARGHARLQAHRHLRGRVRLADRLHVFHLRRLSPARWPTRRAPSDRKKVVILGGGPNRIGQGIEFDYCCCHACFALPMPAMKPSWSTAIPKRSRPTTTPRTGSISSR